MEESERAPIADAALPKGRQRCAIYTRKSAQPPIPYEVSSLESQRAICSSYIASQQHKNWIELPKRYDDPGRSGANLDRPALIDLMNDVELGLIDVVLVYKMDRITRTLLDFVRLINLFERYGVVFVAITQNFDTSDSMGRLIRNILLTFAQFEREMAGDRIRDKKLVMSRRGLWSGGLPPLGYDVRRGKLAINPLEAQAVRCIFESYAETPHLAAVCRQLVEKGYRRKVQRLKDGSRVGGSAITCGSLAHILRNPIYIGEITRCGERNDGIHEPIVSRELWDRVQAILDERERCSKERHASLLTGLLFDFHGRRMSCNSYFDRKSGKTVRYYLSARISWAVRRKLKRTFVLPDQLDRIVLESLKIVLADRPRVRELLMNLGLCGPELDACCARTEAAAARIDTLHRDRLTAALKILLYRVEVAPDCVRVIVRLKALASFIDWDGSGRFGMDRFDLARATDVHVFEVPVSVIRERGRHCLPALPSTDPRSSPSPRLLALLEEAKSAQRFLFSNRHSELSDLALSFRRKPRRFSRLVRLNYLAPDIVAAILDGTQPAGLTDKGLLDVDLPLDWKLQRTLLGFEQREDSQPPRRNARTARIGSGQARKLLNNSRGSTGLSNPKPSTLWGGLRELANALRHRH